MVTPERVASEVADRVVFMDGGRVPELAPPDVLFTARGNQRTADFLSKVLRR
ncbi:hypothetical protein [Streptomyces sp. NPDC057694]|uniref:hypothetical protein n=1 Tax=Streptomyces sp. NPDC057694 TaxID=3346216 RepID=UPI0036CCD9B0